MKILLGVTGSVAAIKLPKLYFALKELGEVKVATTDAGLRIIRQIRDHKVTHLDPLGWSTVLVPSRITNGELTPENTVPLITDQEEWMWTRIGNPVQHIDLQAWADVFVIAPCTANTLAKMALGLCDNLLTCTYRAWPMDKPIVVAPAMNTNMWIHPVTENHTTILRNRHYTRCGFVPFTNFLVVGPVKGKLACGTEGIGAMAPVQDIVNAVAALDYTK